MMLNLQLQKRRISYLRHQCYVCWSSCLGTTGKVFTVELYD